jgi:hypothetical protein
LIRGDSWPAISHRVVEQDPYEMLANSLMIFVAFIPFFALWEVGRVIGFEKLAEMFFRGRAA